MSFFIGYLAPKPVQSFYEQMEGDLSSTFGIRNLHEHVPAHLTLIYPFESEKIDVVEKRLEQYLSTKRTIPFTLSGYAQFNGRKGTIYIDVIPNIDVQLFANTFAEAFKDLNPDRRAGQGITPHLSVARFLNEEKLKEIWIYLQQKPLPQFDILFDNITLFSYRDDRWDVREIFRF